MTAQTSETTKRWATPRQLLLKIKFKQSMKRLRHATLHRLGRMKELVEETEAL